MRAGQEPIDFHLHTGLLGLNDAISRVSLKVYVFKGLKNLWKVYFSLLTYTPHLDIHHHISSICLQVELIKKVGKHLW